MLSLTFAYNSLTLGHDIKTATAESLLNKEQHLPSDSQP
jgi:hypothetical protein